jgi:hypothetical protein
MTRSGLRCLWSDVMISMTPSACADGAFRPGLEMVKETKFFRKQADKAERMARSPTDVELSQRYLNMGQAYRSQAEFFWPRTRKWLRRTSANDLMSVSPEPSPSG